MVAVDRGRGLGKPCGLSVPSLGRAKPPWHSQSLKRDVGKEGHALILGTFTTVPKVHGKGKCSGFRAVFTSGIKSEYQNSLRIYIHHILVKHTPILKSRLTIFAFVKWLELG